MISRKDLERLYEDMSAELYSYLYYLTNSEDDAYDLLQEVFIKLIEWGKRHSIDKNKNIKSFLYKTAHNLYVDHIKKLKAESDQELIQNAKEIRTFQMEEEIENKELVSNIIEVLNKKVDPKTKEAFILFYLEKKKQREIAEILNISERTVRRKISKAIKIIKEEIKL